MATLHAAQRRCRCRWNLAGSSSVSTGFVTTLAHAATRTRTMGLATMNAATQTVFGMEEIALIESGTERDTAIGHHFTTPLNLLTGRRDWKKPGEVVQRWNIIY